MNLITIFVFKAIFDVIMSKKKPHGAYTCPARYVSPERIELKNPGCTGLKAAQIYFQIADFFSFSKV